MSNAAALPPSPVRPADLEPALRQREARRLALFERLRAGLGGGSALPRYLPELSPPLWDLGHLAWQESRLIGRNPGLWAGLADATGARGADPLQPLADSWFDPARVSHAGRWHQLLPPAPQLVGWARATRERSLRLLSEAAQQPAAWPLFGDLLQLEDALLEDWLAMAQTLGLDPGADPGDPSAVPADLATPNPDGIDLATVTWAQVLAFVDAGGYSERAHWSREGWAWRQREQLQRPRHLAATEAPPQEAARTAGVQADDAATGDTQAAPRRARYGRWVPVEGNQPVTGVSLHEAEAWCAWAGRRLPRRDEWLAAQQQAPGFSWGQVWEWVKGEADEDTGLIGASFLRPALTQVGTRPLDPWRNDGLWGWRSAPLD